MRSPFFWSPLRSQCPRHPYTTKSAVLLLNYSEHFPQTSLSDCPHPLWCQVLSRCIWKPLLIVYPVSAPNLPFLACLGIWSWPSHIPLPAAIRMQKGSAAVWTWLLFALWRSLALGHRWHSAIKLQWHLKKVSRISSSSTGMPASLATTDNFPVSISSTQWSLTGGRGNPIWYFTTS